MKLWLDDIRDPARFGRIGFIWAKTAQEAIEMLNICQVTFASLDHDLTVQATLGNWKNEVTGYHVIEWMMRNDIWPKDGVVVHSENEKGRERMERLVKQHYRRLFK